MSDKFYINLATNSLFVFVRWFPAITMACAFVAAPFCYAADAKSKIVTIVPPGSVAVVDWAFDPQTRSVFACGASQVFAFEPQSGKQSKQFDIGAHPQLMLVADRKLVVVDSRGLSMVDLDRQASAGRITNVGQPMAMTYSKRDGYLYLSSTVSQGQSGEQLLQLKLADRYVRNQVPWWQLDTRRVLRLAVSPSGDRLLAAVENRNAPGPYYLYELDNGKLPDQPREAQVGPQGEVSAGPNDHLWFIGSGLYASNDLTQPVQQFKGELTVVHPTQDLAISLANQGDSPGGAQAIVWYQRISTGEEIQREEIRLDLPATTRRQNRRLQHSRLMVDESGAFVFVAVDAGACLIQIPQQILDKVGPSLQLDLPAVLKGMPHQPWKLALSDKASSQKDSTKLRVIKGPPGVRQKDGSIEWQPKLTDVGNHLIEVEVRHGGHVHVAQITASIEIPHTSTGIAAQRLVLDPTGRFACIFGQVAENTRTVSYAARNDPPSHVGIVRLHDQKVLRRESIVGDVRDAFLDEQHLFWIAKNVNVLHRLEFNSSRPIKAIPLHSAVVQLFPLRDDLLVLVLADQNRLTFRVLDRKSLKAIVDHPLAKIVVEPWRQRGNDPVAHEFDEDLLYILGQLIDRRTGQRRCFVSGLHMAPSLVQQDTPGAGLNVDSRATHAWRRMINSGGVRTLAGSQLFRWNARAWAVSRVIPVVGMLQLEPARPSLQINVVLRDIVLGEVIRTDPVPATFENRNNNQLHHDTLLEIAGNAVVVMVGNELFGYQLPDSLLSKVLLPLELEYPDLDIVPVDKNLNFQLQTSGGKAPYRYESLFPHDGIRVHGESGEVGVDLPKIWSDFLTRVSGGGRVNVSGNSGLNRGRQRFEDYAGVSLRDNQTIVSLPLRFQVTDQSGQAEQIEFMLAVVVPQSSLDSAITTGKERIAATRADRLRLRSPEAATATAGNDQLDERINDLERRVRRMEAAIDTLLEDREETETEGASRRSP